MKRWRAAQNFRLITLAFVGAWTALLAFAMPAFARDPAGRWRNSPYHDWFTHAQNKWGEACCADSDAHVLLDGDWRMTGKGYSVRLGKTWYQIDRDQVIYGNPTGRPVVWYYSSTANGPIIYCFSPGTES